jgi:hypothetical protein
MNSKSRPCAAHVNLMRGCIVVLSSLLFLVTATADELPRSGTFEGYCQTNLTRPAKVAGLRCSGRQLNWRHT